MKRGCVAIPVRLDSKRLRQKALISIMGMPMIEHVWRRARLEFPSEEIIILSGDEEIRSSLKHLPIRFFKSLEDHPNGTSRVREFMKSSEEFEFVTVLQGDEILVEPQILRGIHDAMAARSTEVSGINLVSPLLSIADLSDESIVKCCINQAMEMVYLFRKNPLVSSDLSIIRQHIAVVRGMFSLSREAILDLGSLAKIPLSIAESIEQLELTLGPRRIGTLVTDTYYPSINTNADLNQVNRILDSDAYQKGLLTESRNVSI